MSERTAGEIRVYCKAVSDPLEEHPVNIWAIRNRYAEFGVNARTDLPRVLEAAVGLREMVEDLLGYATEAGWPGRDRAAQIMLGETAWLRE